MICMLKNYFLVALRSFRRQGFFSFINVVGLSAGLVCALFIFLWVSDEMRKDQFHSDIGRIYQVVININNPEGIITWDITPGPLAEEIKSTIPEVQYAARLADDGARLVQADDKSYLPNGKYTDPDFFRIFSFSILEGNRENPLPNPSSIVLTQSLARKLFGDDSAIGKTVTVRGDNDLTVTAIIEDVLNSSSIQFEYLAHFDVHKKYRSQEWGNSDYPLYLKFHSVPDISKTTDKINRQVYKTLNITDEENARFSFFLQPFGDRYLNSFFENGRPAGGRIKYVRTFSLVAVFVVIVACINFMNLATARAGVRHKEIGVRKVVGAQRRLIIFQFLAEALLTSALAMIIAIVVVEVTLPIFNYVVSKELQIHYTDPVFLLSVMGIAGVTGLMAGIYPAVVLSGINPARVLKGDRIASPQGISLRRVLVVFQFVISVVLIVSSLVFSKQIHFFQSKNLGFSKDNVLVIPGMGLKNTQLFKDQLLNIPGVSQVSMANENITNVQNQNSSFSWEGMPEDKQYYVRTIVVDYNFIETMGLNIVEGRAFDEALNDSANVIINQKMAAIMGIDPLDVSTDQWGTAGKVVGVVEDFHLRSMSEAMDPVVLLCMPKWTSRFYVRLGEGSPREAVAAIGDKWKASAPEYPFQYTFLDESFSNLYRQEEVISILSSGFTGMAILISALGLLGLATYSTERKRKEISIRKVLGATIGDLLLLLSTEFVLLTLIALLIGSPLGYFLMDNFLSGYAYRVSLDGYIFLSTGLGLLITTLLIVSFQLVRAALSNPVRNLRNE